MSMRYPDLPTYRCAACGLVVAIWGRGPGNDTYWKHQSGGGVKRKSCGKPPSPVPANDAARAVVLNRARDNKVRI